MILRKPFAILIKYFKVIHIILTILSFYLIYRTNLLLNFFNEYMATNNSVIGKDLTGELYSSLMYISLFVIIVGSLIILGLMLFKKKKVKLYIYNIVTYIFVTVVFLYAHSVVISLEVELVDIRTLKIVQDLLTTIFLLQIVSLIIVAIRATGFNVQKFNFTKDLQELEIEDIDNEEFEVNIDLNSDETRRKINRTIRHAKYIYKENKFVILMLLILAIGIGSVAIYMNIGVYNKVYHKGEAFSTNLFTMQLEESYAVDTDYKGNKLYENESFLLIRVNLKNTTSKEQTFDSARLVVNIDEHYFYHESIYSEQMIDIGNIYINQKVSTGLTNYVFIYKVPTKFLNRNIKLIYTDYNGKEIRMKVTPTSLNENVKETSYAMGEKIDFQDSVLENIEATINSVEISNIFRVDYNYCIQDQCYPSYEYLVPTLSGTEDKVLIKINGSVIGNSSSKYENLSSFINYFGYLEYQIGDQIKTVSLSTQNIKPTKTTVQDVCYIETTKEATTAEKINLVFKIRNKTYKYVVK